MTSLADLRTCQVCGRAIKTVQAYPVIEVDGHRQQATEKGETIAHHGYQRPGDGWQTSSCFGARWRPYEIACDALPTLIASCERKIDTLVEAINNWRIEAPAKLDEEETRYGRATGKFTTHVRPDGYDAMRATETGGSYIPHTYDAEFKKRQWARLREIKGTKQAIEFMQQRLVASLRRSRGVERREGRCARLRRAARRREAAAIPGIPTTAPVPGAECVRVSVLRPASDGEGKAS